MKGLLEKLEKSKPLFAPGGKFEKLHPLYEANDTFLFSPADTTDGAPHVRDAIDLKRVMIMVVLALIPCVLWGMFNAGRQYNIVNMVPDAGFVDHFLRGIVIMMPIIIGGNRPGQEIEHPMALVILGGLMTSALLNLLVMPVIYWKFGKS